MEDATECQHGFDDTVGVLPLLSARADAGGLPCGDRLGSPEKIERMPVSGPLRPKEHQRRIRAPARRPGARIALSCVMGFVRISVIALVVAVWLIGGCEYADHIAEGPAVLGEVLAGSPPVPASAIVWTDVREFYRQRENLPAWVTGDETTRAREALEVLRMAQAHGLRATDYGEQDISRLLDSRSTGGASVRDAASRLKQTAELDARITMSLFALGRDVALGHTTPEVRGGRLKARRKAPDFVGTLVAAGSDLTKWLDTIRPQHPQYAALQKALADRRAQQGAGGSPEASIEEGVATIALNLERWRWMPDDLGPRHVLVNIPSYRLTAREDGTAVLDMRVIVGTPERKTPVFSGEMATLVFSPYWNIPDSILVREMAPQAARDPTFLARHDIEILQRSKSGPTAVDPSTIDWNDRAKLRQLAFRQRPGPKNALGLVKFLLPNEFDVYLHDTPAKALFARAGRAFSHGCVRIERAQALAQWVLKDDPEWDERQILEAMHAGVETHVKLIQPLPVHIVYFTAWVDEVGAVRFEPDVYGHDSKL